ncbi:MAG: EpsD family peptidyl-prolyl cis-trans isomerase [Burkholderiales bacterium]|nr:EpsD family peptidyl-prolyl cis-trans isomerase [Burkholderiales bacterium]MDE2296941.1 EpsD family peptidyl-prolyl cis-trans isomerase [Burkholderiales bacterium]
MISSLHAPAPSAGAFAPRHIAVVTAVVLVLVLAGCGVKKDKPATQTAARVNKDEITVHEINFVLQQQRGLAPDQAASASKQVLERLIDQDLALQQAQDQKLDRDPRVLQQLEAARREIIARAYVEKIAAGAPKPSPAEVKAYYDAHPALFQERRIYSLQELAIQAKPDQLDALQAKLNTSKDVPDFINYLKANDFKFSANQVVRPAEQLPLTSLDTFAKMKEGQTIFNRGPNGAQVVILVGVQTQPVDETRATPAIEQFLLNERKRKVVEDDLKALRAAAKIEYLGDYAKGGSKEITPPAPAASEAPPLTSIAPPMPTGSMPSAAPQVEVAPINTAPASAPAAGILDKGLKGFK